MEAHHLSVRPMDRKDIAALVRYWAEAEEDDLHAMGVDPAKLPESDALAQVLAQQLQLPWQKKSAYCVIWEVDGKAVGHTNLNPIAFGEQAKMHLHLWRKNQRQQGLGSRLLRDSLPYFFENFKLKTLFCEPYAFNPAPNRTLDKLGFVFVKQYVTTPGSINFEQWVNRWAMPYERYIQLQISLPFPPL